MIGVRMSRFGRIAVIAVGLVVAGATSSANARGGGHGGGGGIHGASGSHGVHGSVHGSFRGGNPGSGFTRGIAGAAFVGSGIAVARPAPIVRPLIQSTAVAAPIIRPETVYNSAPIVQSRPRSRSAPVSRPPPLAQKRPQVRRVSETGPTYGSATTTGGSCDRFREQAIASGNGIWWERYYDCTGDYY